MGIDHIPGAKHRPARRERHDEGNYRFQQTRCSGRARPEQYRAGDGEQVRRSREEIPAGRSGRLRATRRKREVKSMRSAIIGIRRCRQRGVMRPTESSMTAPQDDPLATGTPPRAEGGIPGKQGPYGRELRSESHCFNCSLKSAKVKETSSTEKLLNQPLEEFAGSPPALPSG
jgi:hypothetical protein